MTTNETIAFVAGFNMCGYMPDNEAHGCEDFKTARAVIVEDLEQLLNDEDFDEEEVNEAITWVKAQPGPFTLTLNGYAYWVQPSE